MSTRVLEILLVDDEPDLLDIVKVFISTLYQAQFTFAHSGKEAITHLKKGHQYDVVVCDYEMNDGNGGEVYSFMKSEGIKIPFILLSAYDPSRYSEFSDGGVAGYVNKPHIFEPLTEILEQLLGSPESFSPGNKEEKFVEVGLTLLKNIEVAPTNFYVRLGEGHAVKVIYKGSLISQKDLLRYSDKGVTSLLFDVLDAEVFLKSYSETVFSLLEDYHNVAGEGEQEHYYKQTTQLLRDLSNELGWPEELQELAKKHVDVALKLVEKSQDIKNHLKRMFDGSGGYFAKHSAALSLISVITAQKMGWASDYTGIKLVMASMLHDFSLTDHQVESLTDIVPMINNPKYSEVEDVIAVREHPRKAAEMVRGIRGLPLGIDEVLLQHHERPDGSGFPSRLVWKEIAPLSALFIVCEDLVDDFFLSKALGEFDLSSFAEKRKSVYSKGPFKEILTALAKIEDHSK